MDVAFNDSDPDGDLDVSSVSLVAGSGPGWGVVVNHGDGTVTYTPAGGFSGSDSFEYRICDLTLLCDTDTVTVSVGVSDPLVFVSFSSTTVVPGVGSVRDEDIVSFDSGAGVWAMYFDASDVGITSSDLDAFDVRGDGSVLMSYSSSSFTVPGLTGGPDGTTVDDSDVFLFVPTSTGDVTAGSFSFYLDGSDVGLDSSGEDIDGLFEFGDGSLGISTTGDVTVGGLVEGGDEDVHRFTGSYGAATVGAWVLYFDGSDVGLTGADDDINGLAFDGNGDLLFSTVGVNTVPGSDDEDINRFVGSYGPVTAGIATLELDLSGAGIDTGESVDGLHLGP